MPFTRYHDPNACAFCIAKRDAEMSRERDKERGLFGGPFEDEAAELEEPYEPDPKDAWWWAEQNR